MSPRRKPTNRCPLTVTNTPHSYEVGLDPHRYARVSTARQRESLDTQRDALLDVGCDPTHFFADTVSGSKWERPGLKKAFSYMRPGGS
ncbi:MULTISPECIES: recombinase family protein [unclassified Pauljensenia]|uniref:recombinase family protein n=1 Tax=unclassified Pauljensenia TaxID=2908895 RepID=UPI0015C7F7C4